MSDAAMTFFQDDAHDALQQERSVRARCFTLKIARAFMKITYSVFQAGDACERTKFSSWSTWNKPPSTVERQQLVGCNRDTTHSSLFNAAELDCLECSRTCLPIGDGLSARVWLATFAPILRTL